MIDHGTFLIGIRNMYQEYVKDKTKIKEIFLTKLHFSEKKVF